MVGTKLSHFEITAKIGEGGMGEVFLARDTKLDREVALKFLPLALQQDEGARIRFIREAKAAAAIDHPFICSIYEVGETDNGQDFNDTNLSARASVAEYAVGDVLGIRVVGSQVECLINGEVKAAGVDNDPHMTPGYIALFLTDSPAVRGDDFGGGSFNGGSNWNPGNPMGILPLRFRCLGM